MKWYCPSESFCKSVLVKRTIPLFFFFIIALDFFGQTTNISGIVNTYHRVIEIIPAKACLRVASVTGLNVNTRIMVVQMKGASVNTSNSSSFGTVTAYNDAGNYEIGTICYIIGDSVFLFHNLLNTYEPVNGKVQIVQFAEYMSANVIDTVKALPWNNTSGTGGVIALFADQDITLNAPVYANNIGYSGGSSMQSSSSCHNGYSGYIYNPTSGTQGGAYKGESITTLTTAQSGGRGSPASGGGGGNNHNNSGGGGANLNNGGDGGGNSSGPSAGCNATFKGLGGKALSSNAGQKIFMGGGGGAGHYNYSGSNSYGGNGGGIIFIWANNINGNNQMISAGGSKGGNGLSDGAGGGGGGGTIILHSNNYTGNLLVNANGGNGGDTDDALNLNFCYGGGGGGSGGVIYFTGGIPPVTNSINRGTAGLEIGRHDPSCGTIQPASDGNDGQVISSYTFRMSLDPAGYCLLLLPSRLMYFKAALNKEKVLFNWRVLNPESVKYFIIERKTGSDQWLATGIYTANDTTEVYKAEDLQSSTGNIFYRLKIVEKNNNTYYSAIVMVDQSASSNVFNFYPNPAIDKFYLSRTRETRALLLLTDLNGKIVWKKEVAGKDIFITLPVLPKGMYLLRLDQATKKLIIH